MSKIKIGVIGCGARGSGAFINLTVNHFNDSCELIAICDKYLNSVTNSYDLRVKGEYISGIIHDLNDTDTLYNSNTTSLENHDSSDIILFFKSDNSIDIENDKLVLY